MRQPAPPCALAHLSTRRGAAAGRAWVAAPQPSHGRCAEVHGRSTPRTHTLNTLVAMRGPGGGRSGAASAEKQLVKGRKGPAVAGLPPRRQSFRARYRYLCPPPIGGAAGDPSQTRPGSAARVWEVGRNRPPQATCSKTPQKNFPSASVCRGGLGTPLAAFSPARAASSMPRGYI